MEVKLNKVIEHLGLQFRPFDEVLGIVKNDFPCRVSAFSGTIVTANSQEEVEEFITKYYEEKKIKEAAQKAWEEMPEEEKRAYEKQLASIMVTSGYDFEGYRIVKYSGYISGDDAVSVERGFDGWIRTGTNIGEKLLSSLTKIRQKSLRELKEAALALDCNAIIGVDFDYLTLDPQTANLNGGTTYYPYIFCVTANGTAVVIEKE